MKILVRAVAGRLHPDPSGIPGRWLGWVPTTPAKAEHIIPAGPGSVYLARSEEPTEVEETASIRRALARGDLARVERATDKPARAKGTTSES